MSVTSAPTPQLILDDPVSAQRATLTVGPGSLAPGQARISALAPSGDLYEVDLGGRRADLPGQVLDSSHAWLNSIGFAGNLAALHTLTITGQDWLIAAPVYGQGLATYRLGADGSATRVTQLEAGGAHALSGVASIASARIDGTPYVITAATHDNTISVFQMGTGGQLWQTDRFGISQDLPIHQPVSVQTVVFAGTHYVVVGAFGSQSLSVLRLDAGGSLTFVDQIIDTRETRFAQTTALDTISVDGRVLVAAAGQDGGVSLFEMVPGGRLVHRDTLVDGLATALDGVRELHFVEHSGGLDLFALSTRDAGLTRLSVDLGPAGVTGAVSQGSAGDDVISPAAGRQDVRGAAGDDILVDGEGAESLWGGDGADLFVFGQDGQTDTIMDFAPHEDHIDLTGAGRLYQRTDLNIWSTSGTVVVQWAQETLTVRGAPGATLTPQTVADALVFEIDRVTPTDRVPQQGTAQNDVFIWSPGPDTIDGGAGSDLKDYTMAPDPIHIDLTDPSRNAWAADGDTLISIERITGTGRNDTIYGDTAANTLIGLAGNDALHGNAGSDWIMPGGGRDTIFGGAGSDMISLADLSHAARIHLNANHLSANGQTSHLSEIENVTGTIFADVIEGDAQANRLRGLGDYDWFLGTEGNDSYDGGDGRDMISYVNGTAGVTVNLAQGTGLAGLATGDRYSSIERVTGSIHADLIYGGTMEEDIRGLGGYDWFIGSPGRDRFDGGAGVDMVAYWTSPTGVVASLSLGRGAAGDAARDLYTSIEGLTGSGFADDLTGDGGRNVLRGLGGADTLDGRGGVDRLEGGAGNDVLDGGWGWDLAIFSGQRGEYTVRSGANGSVIVEDSRGWRDGTDQLRNIEALQFSDGLFYF